MIKMTGVMCNIGPVPGQAIPNISCWRRLSSTLASGSECESRCSPAVLRLAMTEDQEQDEAQQQRFDEAGRELLTRLGLDSDIEPSEYDSANVVFQTENGAKILVGDHRFAK